MNLQGLQPVLLSERLLLRPLTLHDAPAIQTMAAAKQVAEMTANIPHPYPSGAAEQWIGQHMSAWQHGLQVDYGITLISSQDVIGAIGLVFKNKAEAELGYWVGVDYWGYGYATEAAKRLVLFGFDEMNVNSIKARVLNRNPASGRVLLKSGFRYSQTVTGDCGSKHEPLDCYERRAKPTS